MKKLRFNNMKQFSQDSSFVDPGFKFRSFPPKQTLLYYTPRRHYAAVNTVWSEKQSLGASFQSLQPVSTLTHCVVMGGKPGGHRSPRRTAMPVLGKVRPTWSSSWKPDVWEQARAAEPSFWSWLDHPQAVSKKHWWGIPPHSLQSHDQEYDVACRILSDASYSLGKWLKPAQQRQDDDSWQPQSPMAAQRRMTMPGFSYVFLIFFFYEGIGGRWRHMTCMVISTGWISKLFPWEQINSKS